MNTTTRNRIWATVATAILLALVAVVWLSLYRSEQGESWSRTIATWGVVNASRFQLGYLFGSAVGFAAGLLVGIPGGHFFWPHYLPSHKDQ